MVGFCALALALAFSGLAVMAFWAGQASRGCWAGGGGGGERYYDGKYARDCCIAESTGLDNSHCVLALHQSSLSRWASGRPRMMLTLRTG